MMVMKIKIIKKHKSVTKRKLKFEDHKNCLETNKHKNEINHLEKMILK